MKRTEISKLKPGKVLAEGFIDSLRDTKALVFLVIRDASGMVQVTIKKDKSPELAELVLGGLQLESTLKVWGELVENASVKLNGVEIIPDKIEVTSFAKVSPIDEGSSPDLLMDYRWLDLRNEEKRGWFQMQTKVLRAIREWFVDNGYIEIMTPKLSAFTTEGGSEVFEVKYFDRKAYLTQSPQLFKQMAISAGFEKVFEIGGCYRAEKSHTARHAAEFFALDVELGHVADEHCAMDAEESMLRYVFKKVFNEDLPKFPRVTLKEVFDLLGKPQDVDLSPDDERALCVLAKEKWNSDFIFVTQFPFRARAFYSMKRDDDPTICRGFDLLFKGVEITSGAQREHRPENLRQNMRERGINPKDMEFYIQFFEYGCPQHGGYALGIGRLMAKILNTPSIKDTTFLFRGPDRLAP